jgi:AraC-like DNA-binding protein
MLTALSEPVMLPPATGVRVERVSQAADDPLPRRLLHFHAPAELVLMEAGHGRFISDAGDCAFAPGTVLYAPAMAVHDFAFEPGPRRWTLVQFDAFALDAEGRSLPGGAAGAGLGAADFKRALALSGWLSDLLDDAAPAREVLVVLEALLLSLKDGFGATATGRVDTPSRLTRFRPVLEHLGRSPAKVLGLAEAAALCALSPAYFSRGWKGVFGTGFITYQTRFRLLQAARMLATGDEPVSQVAYRLGFRSHAYFSQCFKATFGVAPSRHRRHDRPQDRPDA